MGWGEVLRSRFISAFSLALMAFCSVAPCVAENYPIVDTGQERCYDNSYEITYPRVGEPFFGQDAQYLGNQPAYRDNEDGTVTDLVTDLMWQKDPGAKKTLEEAIAGASACRVGGYDDWRLPSIKEMYSLIMFYGEDVSPQLTDTTGLKPFINTEYFDFSYGDPTTGERIIDSQMATSTKYVSTTMYADETVFGVNFADGRIKGYPASSNRPGRGAKKFFVFYVRGNPEYGRNKFRDNGDGTIADEATGLTWMQVDSGHLKAGESKDGKLNWEQALQWAENLEYAGHSDWRLPNIKELQSIVDYTRSPDTTNSAAIDPMFRVTPIRDGLDKVNYPFYWSGTTHVRDGGNASAGCYFAFGRSQGWMSGRFGGEYNLLDVHGAGSQRCDPKAGDPAQFPRGRGPQGDVIGIYNMVRAVRGGDMKTRSEGPKLEPRPETPQRFRQGPPEGGRPGMQGNGPPGRQRGPMRPGGSGRQQGMGPGNQRPGVEPQRSMALPGGASEQGGTFRFMTLYDRNQDGQVTAEEFDGPPLRFIELDEDGDWVVSRDEAAQAGPPNGGRRPAGDRSDSGGDQPRGPRDRGSSESSASEVPPSVDEEVRVDATWNDLPPSFVFILADDMGWTGTSVPMDDQVPESKSDYYQTPNLQRLAQEGLRFTQAYAPASQCTPTRAAILTGRTPAALHVTTPGGGRTQGTRKLLTPSVPRIKIEDGEVTVAEALKEVGYATAHLGKWHLGLRGDPGDHGFDFHDGNTENDGPGHLEDPNPKDIFGITERAIDFMKGQVQQKKPFYLHLSHYAVHLPTLVRNSTLTTFDNLPRGTRHRDAAYAAMTFDLDDSIGTLLAEMEELGIADNTYMAFMSDNGAPSGPRRGAENQPLAGGKAQLYEGGIRVPFIVRGPGIQAGSFCREAVTGCDLLPTYCELAGATYPEDIDGTSMVPLWKGIPGSFHRDEPSLLFHYPHYSLGASVPQSALVVGKYKIIRDYESDSVQLFDLTEDRSESNDLARALPEKAKELEQLLDDRLKQADAQMTSLNPDYDPNAPATQARPGGGRGGRGRARGGRSAGD